MNSKLSTKLRCYKVASFLEREKEKEKEGTAGCCAARSVLSIVIPRSHAIPDKTSLRVINLPGKLTSLEGTSTFQLVTTRYSTRYVLVGEYNRRINNLRKVSGFIYRISILIDRVK